MNSLTSDMSRPRPRRPLTQGQKAAVIVRLLVNGGADPGIRELPRDQQRKLVLDMASLRFVDRRTLAETVAEFAGQLDAIGLHFPREIDKVLAALDGRLSIDVVEMLAAEIGLDVSALGRASWEQISGLDQEVLMAMIADESDEVAAIMLSKLPATKAAQLIGTLPRARADAIAAAFGRTEEVTPDAVARIGNALGRQSGTRIAPAFDSDSVVRVGNILNAATSAVRGALLDRLDETDPEFAKRVRAAVFSFENIPGRLAARDVPKALRNVDSGAMVAAFAGAPPELAHVAEFIFANISSRLADQLREDMEEAGTVPADKAEEAMSAIVAEIRRLEDAGEISFVVAEDKSG